MKLTILNILQLCQLWTMQLAMETGTTDYVHNLRTKKSQLSGVLGRYIELQFIFTPTNEDTLNKFTVIYDENGEKSFSIYTQNMTSTFVMNSTSSKDFSFDINMVEGTFDLVLKNTKKNDVLNISVTAFYGNVEETSTVEIVKIMENPIVPLFNAKYITSNELVTLSWMCSTYNPVKSIDIHYIRTKTNQEIFISNKAIDKNSLTISLTAYEFRYVDGFLYVYIYNVSSSDSFDFVLRLQYFSNIGQNPTFETSVIHVNVEDTNDDCNTHGNSTCLIGHTTSNSLESTYMTYHHKSNVQITSTAYNQSIETLQISPSILPSLTFIPNHYRSTEDTGKLTLLTSVFPIERSKYIKIVSTSSLLSNSKDLNHNKSTTFQMHKSVAFQMQNSNKTIAMDQSSSVQSSVGPTTTSKYTQNIFTDLAKVNVTISNVANISLTLESMLQDGLDENKITENDIETVINLVSSCLDVTTSDEKVNKNLLGAANIIIKSTDKVSLNRNVKKTFRYQLKRIAIGSTVNNTDGFHYKGEEISLFSFVQKSSEEIALFVSDSNDISKSSQLQPNHTISSIIINNGTFLMKINNTSNLSMYSYSFTNDRLFEGIDSKQVIVSSILDFTLPNFKIENLDKNFSINFQTNTLETDLECGYWSEDKEIWETSGCVTIINQKQNSNKGFVECKCNHLTSFSVLLTVEGATESKILTYVSTAGSVISLCGLLFTLLNYAIFPELRKTVAANTICNMCFSIASVLLIFLLGSKQTKNKTVCCIIASFLQYFLLTTFFWMAFMSMTLYRDIVKPMEYRQRGRLFKIISMLIAWGIPIVLVGATYPLVKVQFDEEEKTLCVIEGELSLYVTVVPSACIILFNLVMFIPIFYSLQKHLTRISNYQNRSLLYQRCRDSIVCILLLGLTWIFGLLCIRDAKLLFEYIFAILNSLQGFFIFISQVVNNNDARKLWSDLLTKYYKARERKIHASTIQIKDMSSKKKSEAAKVS